VPDQVVGAKAKALEQPEKRDLERKQRRLGVFGVV